MKIENFLLELNIIFYLKFQMMLFISLFSHKFSIEFSRLISSFFKPWNTNVMYFKHSNFEWVIEARLDYHKLNVASVWADDE